MWMMNLAFVFVMRIIYSVRISLRMMSSCSRILILVANLLIKEMIYGDYLVIVVIDVNRRSGSVTGSSVARETKDSRERSSSLGGDSGGLPLVIFEGLNETAMDDAAILFNGEDGVPARGDGESSQKRGTDSCQYRVRCRQSRRWWCRGWRGQQCVHQQRDRCRRWRRRFLWWYKNRVLDLDGERWEGHWFFQDKVTVD